MSNNQTIILYHLNSDSLSKTSYRGVFSENNDRETKDITMQKQKLTEVKEKLQAAIQLLKNNEITIDDPINTIELIKKIEEIEEEISELINDKIKTKVLLLVK